MSINTKTVFRTVLVGLLLISIAGCFGGRSRKKKYVPPSLAISHNNRGVQYLGVQDFKKAEWEFKTAVEMDPKYAEAWNNLGLVKKFISDYPMAVHYLRTAIKVRPKWASPYNHLGAVYIATGEIGKAIPYIKKAIEKDKKYADAYYNLGICYRELVFLNLAPKKNRKRAIKAMKKATDLDQLLYHAHADLGDMYLEMQDWERAIIRYRLAIETKPGDPEFWIKLATLYLEKGDPQRAESAYERADQLRLQNGLASKDLTAALGYAEALIEHDQYKQAVVILGRIVELDPYNERAYFDIGYAAFHLKDFEASELSYKHALDINPDFVEAAFNLGMTYLSLGKKESAIEAYRTALSVRPNDPRTLYNLGMLYHNEGFKAEARDTLCQFIKNKEKDHIKELKIARQIVRENGGCRAQ